MTTIELTLLQPHIFFTIMRYCSLREIVSLALTSPCIYDKYSRVEESIACTFARHLRHAEDLLGTEGYIGNYVDPVRQLRRVLRELPYTVRIENSAVNVLARAAHQFLIDFFSTGQRFLAVDDEYCYWIACLSRFYYERTGQLLSSVPTNDVDAFRTHVSWYCAENFCQGYGTNDGKLILPQTTPWPMHPIDFDKFKVLAEECFVQPPAKRSRRI